MQTDSLTSHATPAQRRVIAWWLFACCVCVFLMVVVGGLTRLTESGLSIVEWRPVTGTLPPLGETAWLEEFEKYRQSPEYLKKNAGMSLEEFKGIFWLEYLHRLFGRLTGLVFAAPLLYFIARRQLSGRQIGGLAVILALGAVQGGIGWWMVKSGLHDYPRVSHLRLTVHLGFAFLLFTLLLRMALSVMPLPPRTLVSRSFYRLCHAATGLIFLQVLLGGLVAGLDAGLIHNTFPDMDGQWVPSEIFALQPWYVNFFENVTMVQFQHRMNGYLTAGVVCALWWRARREPLNRNQGILVHALLVCMLAQIALGAYTVVQQVPIAAASKHQALALILYALALTTILRFRKQPPQTETLFPTPHLAQGYTG